MHTIPFIPQRGFTNSSGSVWNQTDSCSGFIVSDDCPYRYDDLQLVTYTP